MHNLEVAETIATPAYQVRKPYLITEQTWDSVHRIADVIDEAFNKVSPQMVVGSNLIFFPLDISPTTNGKVIEAMRPYAQSFMENLKARFAPKSRIQIKKRMGIYRLEWKSGVDKKSNITAIIDDNIIAVTPPDTTKSEEFLQYITGIYEAASECQLYSDHYNQDGVPIGTGKGYKVTLSGESPDSSPFLERPDLLMSLVTYWQNHPSLSYLFSGENVGPMGHAPRADEIRKDILYELDITSKNIPKPGLGKLHPEVVDQIFRHKLIDSFGNMSGAEICIDKLYPVDNEEQRQGIVELRCFEMVPDPKLLLLQHLIVKAIIARCFEEPYRERFINWGAALQNEFMLPYFLELDFQDVLMDLEAFGYEFKFQYFAAQFARRFPQLGRVTLDDVELDLSMALEPQNTFQATNNLSSIPPKFQRLQLRTKKLDPDRHVVTCNGFLVPLTEPDTNGVQVASIRLYKYLPKLPSKEVMKRTPNKLTFELIDKQTKLSLGGFLYKMVSHEAEDDSFMTDPIKARETRLGTFDPFIPYGGEVFINPAPKSLDMPNMLDLRQV